MPSQEGKLDFGGGQLRLLIGSLSIISSDGWQDHCQAFIGAPYQGMLRLLKQIGLANQA
ncbi:MAG: hypothetical protein ACJZ72_02570 [Opitutales bacterium]